MTVYIDYGVTNSAQIEADLGRRVAELRLSRNITQRDLASAAGIGLSTMRRVEGGEGISLDTFVRVLIGLGIQTNLTALVPDPAVRPVERVKNKGKQRRRARPRKKEIADIGWSWDPQDD